MKVINWWSSCLVMVFCWSGCKGAVIKNVRPNQTETIVAVAGVSPALLDTAMAILDGGRNGNWHFSSNFLGGKDKVLPFPVMSFPLPMMEAPKPFMNMMPPMPAGLAALQKPQQESTGEKDQASTGPGPVQHLIPLTSLTPQQAATPQEAVVEAQEEPEVTLSAVEVEQAPGVAHVVLEEVEAAPEVAEVESKPVLLTPEITEMTVATQVQTIGLEDAEREELMGAPPAEAGWSSSPSSGHINSPQTGTHSLGNQLLSMNLNGNMADFSTTSNVNMQVISNGASTSNVHSYGARINPDHKPHPGVNTYKVQFKKHPSSILPSSKNI